MISFHRVKPKIRTPPTTCIGVIVSFKTKTETTQNYEHVIVYGNIQSLLNFSDECPDYCFYKLFYGCWNLTSDNLILPAMKVGNYSYSNLFYLNQTLTKLPQLPATEIRSW